MLMTQETHTIELTNRLMESADVFFGAGALFFFVGAIFLTALAGLGILYMVTIIAPGTTDRCSGSMRERFIVCSGAGLVINLIALLLVGALQAVPALNVVVISLFGCAVLVGWSSASEDIGRRLFWISGREGSRASHLAAGWLVFVYASSFPILGWFVIFPVVTWAGLGSLAMSLFRPPKPEAYLRREA